MDWDDVMIPQNDSKISLNISTLSALMSPFDAEIRRVSYRDRDRCFKASRRSAARRRLEVSTESFN